MRGNSASYQRATRVHAVILTRDRPESLERCVKTALSALRADDTVTVLDDSCAMMSHANAAVLTRAARCSVAHFTHLRAELLHDVIARATGRRRALWQSRTAPRDIAPLRNLSLLLSVVYPAETTLFIDDDIHGFDLVDTHLRVSALAKATNGVIAGANIVGISEQDTITRLADAIDTDELAPNAQAMSIRELFQVPGFASPTTGNVCRYVSAGYLAFRFSAERRFAFPPGYNEDWLWCLLYGGNAQVRVLRAGRAVVHDPPCVRKPAREDFLFELTGDLVFQCLEECRDCNDSDPEDLLLGLSNWRPSPALMPSVRAHELLDKARFSSQNRGCAHLLEEYGLAVLADILQAGELEMDGTRVLADWCGDAIAKHKSFTLTLQDDSAMSGLKSLLQEGRL